MKKCAVINDLSGFGKCSLTAALPIISAMGVEAHPLPTAVLSNQTAYESYKSLSLTDCMKPFYAEWKKLGVSFDSILTGFVTDERQLDIINDFVDEFKNDNTILVVDPVMADNGKLYDCYNDAMCKKIISLCYRADIITPNIAELAFIADEPYSEKLEDIKAYGTKLINNGIKNIVVTGYTEDDAIINIVFAANSIQLAKAKKHGGYFSGTGDILSSIVCTGVTRGMSLFESTLLATEFIEKAVSATPASTSNDGVNFEYYLSDLTKGVKNE